MLTFLALPRSSKVTFSRDKPTSSEITLPPAKIAISWSIAFLLSPKPGAFTAATLTIPLIVLTTNVAKASPSTSSAIINSGLPDFATASNNGKSSLIFDIFLSWRSIYGSSKSQVILSWLFAK